MTAPRLQFLILAMSRPHIGKSSESEKPTAPHQLIDIHFSRPISEFHFTRTSVCSCGWLPHTFREKQPNRKMPLQTKIKLNGSSRQKRFHHQCERVSLCIAIHFQKITELVLGQHTADCISRKN